MLQLRLARSFLLYLPSSIGVITALGNFHEFARQASYQTRPASYTGCGNMRTIRTSSVSSS